MSTKEEVVCVTGGSGYIGSWLVRLLLERGYTVHSTVRDLSTSRGGIRIWGNLGPDSSSPGCKVDLARRFDDEKETKHLLALEGAETSLQLFQIDLLDYDSIVKAITGTVGVFHIASPCTVDEIKEPVKEVLDPAVKGTKNVLTAAKELGVRRVVVTSSISSITPSPSWPADVVKREDCWTDVEYCKQKGVIMDWGHVDE
ncbi:hypothetical protein Ancab_014731 [Ancistrocladus abbreviatus]